jgi:uncharacterized protein with HEPN domain
MRIEDILDAIAAIQEYTCGMDPGTFAKDRRTVDAVLRNITIIGEAAGHVPPDVADAHPHIPWRVMRDFRNVVVHAYFGIQLSILWDTIQDDLPPLVIPLKKLLGRDA